MSKIADTEFCERYKKESYIIENICLRDGGVEIKMKNKKISKRKLAKAIEKIKT